MSEVRYAPTMAATATDADPGLRLSTRAALRVKHGARLGRDVFRFGVEQRLWWFLPLVVLLLLVALAATATTTAVPVAVYTLF